jgi:hypothetical protein
MWAAAVNAAYRRASSDLCEPGYCSAEMAYLTTTPLGFADLMLPALKPDWVVWNCGFWGGCAVQPEEFIAASVKAVNNHNPRNVFWKTTTTKADGGAVASEDEEAGVIARFRKLHSRIMPAHQLTADMHEAHAKQVKALHAAAAASQADGGASGGDPTATTALELHTDMLHFRPHGYQEMNTLLLNMLAFP